MIKDKIFDGANEKANNFYKGWNQRMPDHFEHGCIIVLHVCLSRQGCGG